MKIIDEDGNEVGYVSRDGDIVFDPPVGHGQFALGLDIEVLEGVEREGVPLIQKMQINCLRAIRYQNPRAEWRVMHDDPPEEGMNVVVANPVRDHLEEGDEVILSERGTVVSRRLDRGELAIALDTGEWDSFDIWDFWWEYDLPEPPPLPRKMIDAIYKLRDGE